MTFADKLLLRWFKEPLAYIKNNPFRNRHSIVDNSTNNNTVKVLLPSYVQPFLVPTAPTSIYSSWTLLSKTAVGIEHLFLKTMVKNPSIGDFSSSDGFHIPSALLSIRDLGQRSHAPSALLRLCSSTGMINTVSNKTFLYCLILLSNFSPFSTMAFSIGTSMQPHDQYFFETEASGRRAKVSDCGSTTCPNSGAYVKSKHKELSSIRLVL